MFDENLPPDSSKQVQEPSSETTKGESYALRRQARHISRAGGVGEILDFREICERDDWTCHICGCEVDPQLRYPNPRSKSLDHVIPLARGGAHTAQNTRLAHLVCNLRKGKQLTEEMKGEGEYVTPGSSSQARTYEEFMHLARVENPERYKEVVGTHKVVQYRNGRKRSRRGKYTELDADFQEEGESINSPSSTRNIGQQIYRQWMADQWT